MIPHTSVCSHRSRAELDMSSASCQSLPQSSSVHCSPSASICTSITSLRSRRLIVPDHLLDLLLVRLGILLEQRVRIRLRRTVWIWLVQQRLHTEKDVLQRDRGLPAFVLVQNAETDGAGGIDIGMEQRRREADLGRLCWVFCGLRQYDCTAELR